MDAGVPIKAPVAGISCGLITDGDPLHGGRWMTMLDIQGVEDFHGDMDFKVGGTRRGITAIQMDIKVDGLTYEIVEEASRSAARAVCTSLTRSSSRSSPSRAPSCPSMRPRCSA